MTNPPGSTSEQLPDHVLALLPPRPYLSTACDTAWLLEAARLQHRDRDDVGEHARQMHDRCRLNHKFTGANCVCACHTTA